MRWIDTFVHAVDQLAELLGLAVILVLPPHLPIVAPQKDQLPLLAPQGAEVGDLHNDWPGEEERRKRRRRRGRRTRGWSVEARQQRSIVSWSLRCYFKKCQR